MAAKPAKTEYTVGDTFSADGLKVVKVDEEKNLLLVKGSVPGHKNGFVVVVSDR